MLDEALTSAIFAFGLIAIVLVGWLIFWRRRRRPDLKTTARLYARRASTSDISFGTIGYAAPEQLDLKRLYKDQQKIVRPAFLKDISAKVDLPARMLPSRSYEVIFTLIGRKVESEIRRAEGRIQETKTFEVRELPPPLPPPRLTIRPLSVGNALDFLPREEELEAPRQDEEAQVTFYATPRVGSGVHKILFQVLLRSTLLTQLNADVEISSEESPRLLSSSSLRLLEISSINKTFAVRETFRGGLGLVHKVEDVDNPGKFMAAKTYFEDGSGGKDASSFKREAINWLSLGSHSHVVQAFLVADVDGRPYVFCEFADGGNLRNQLAGGPVPIYQALEWVDQICEGLHHAHSHGLVHCDLKPENIMLTREGVVKITDFGLTRAIPHRLLTEPVDLKGTIPYMAPELLIPEARVDHRADIYSLGVVFYELLAGKRPFEPRDLLGAISQRPRPQPPSLFRKEIPKQLDLVVVKCLASKPEGRPSRVLEISEALRKTKTKLST